MIRDARCKEEVAGRVFEFGCVSSLALLCVPHSGLDTMQHGECRVARAIATSRASMSTQGDSLWCAHRLLAGSLIAVERLLDDARGRDAPNSRPCGPTPSIRNYKPESALHLSTRSLMPRSSAFVVPSVVVCAKLRAVPDNP